MQTMRKALDHGRKPLSLRAAIGIATAALPVIAFVINWGISWADGRYVQQQQLKEALHDTKNDILDQQLTQRIDYLIIVSGIRDLTPEEAAELRLLSDRRDELRRKDE